MSSLLILGAGGHGKVVLEIAKLSQQWDNIAFLDDQVGLKTVLGARVLGKFKDFPFMKDKYKHAFVALGNNSLRMKWINILSDHGFVIPTLIHPFTSISPSSTIKEGTVVMAGCVINASTNIGKGCIINTSSTIDHDCEIQDGVHISPGVHIAGSVSVKKYTWVGIGATIINNITIGSNVVVGAGSVVNRNIPDNVMVAGVPAVIKKQLGVKNDE